MKERTHLRVVTLSVEFFLFILKQYIQNQIDPQSRTNKNNFKKSTPKVRDLLERVLGVDIAAIGISIASLKAIAYGVAEIVVVTAEGTLVILPVAGGGAIVLGGTGLYVGLSMAIGSGGDLLNLISETTQGAGNADKYTFNNQKKFDKHFDKHVVKQGEFGNITKDEYLKLANKFIDSSGENVLSRVASNGDVLKFNSKTNEFSIVTKDGVIRTYHKLNPDIHGKGTNLDYWNGPDCNY